MSRGLGREQKLILSTIANAPDKRWGRMEIQHAAWGAQVRHMGLKRNPQYSRPHRNVAWWRTDPDGERRQNFDSTFTRALGSLERRGLLARHKEPGCHAWWIVTPL